MTQAAGRLRLHGSNVHRGFPFLPSSTKTREDVCCPSPRICYCFTKQTQNWSHSCRWYRPRSHPRSTGCYPCARVCNPKARVYQPRRWFRVFPKTWDCSPRCLCAVSVRLVQSSPFPFRPDLLYLRSFQGSHERLRLCPVWCSKVGRLFALGLFLAS